MTILGTGNNDLSHLFNTHNTYFSKSKIEFFCCVTVYPDNYRSCRNYFVIGTGLIMI